MIERIRTQAWSRSVKQACVVCAAVLPPLRTMGQQIQSACIEYPCCQTVACRMIVSRRGEMSEAGFKHYLEIEARQTQGRLARAKLAQQKSETEARENLAAWSKLRRSLKSEALQMQLLQLVVPSGPGRASKITAQRRQSYRDHLAKIIAEALNGPEPELQSAPEPLSQQTGPDSPSLAAPAINSKLPGQLCTLCGGGCCTRGGNEAYLTAATMRRVLSERPDLQAPSDLLALYLDRLPSKSQTSSCINHGPQGCTLSRDLRSDICNNYACEALARLQYAQRQAKKSRPQDTEPIAVLVLRRKQDNWLRSTPGLDNAIKAGALLKESGAEHLTVPRAIATKAIRRAVHIDDRLGKSAPAPAAQPSVCADHPDSL